MSYKILSVYDEEAPERVEYPNGQVWNRESMSYRAAFNEVCDHLVRTGGFSKGDSPYVTNPMGYTFSIGDTYVLAGKETIFIVEESLPVVMAASYNKEIEQ